MIRISVEVPKREEYRFEPLMAIRERLLADGYDAGFRVDRADLRVIELEEAAEELRRRPDGHFPTPTIIDEENDGAEVGNTSDARSIMAHPDVKAWLKQNTFRDFELHNTPFATGQYHTEILNAYPRFRLDVPHCPLAGPVTAEMAAKIRLLPIAGVSMFASLAQNPVASAPRTIDVMFAGHVDYPEAFHYHAVTRVLASRHRRAAVEQLSAMRDRKILLGVNRPLATDLYEAALRRTTVSVSPYGLGEMAYRDYESIFAGCVVVKPSTDHVRTFAPDIYQAGTYYWSCSPDFSDLPEVIERVLADRHAAAEFAQRTRDAVVRANAPDQVHAHYLAIFKEALGG